jgi:M6 family metalloprotease-like protein
MKNLAITFALALILTAGAFAIEGKNQEIQGTLNVLITDFLDGTHETTYELINDQGSHKVNFLNDPNLLSGSQISALGSSTNQGLFISEYEVDYSVPQEPIIGGERIVTLLVYPNDFQGDLIDPDVIWGIMYDSQVEGSAQSYIREVSYDKAYIGGPVRGWFELDMDHDAMCSNYLLSSINAADPYVDFSQYDGFAVIFPFNQNCGFSGKGSLGSGGNFVTDDGIFSFYYFVSNGWQILDKGLISHELGHNFGRRHSNDYECGELSISDSCLSLEYGDHFDVLGKTSRQGHYNPAHKEALGWFDDSQIIEATDGIFTLTPYEIPEGLKAIKIPREDGLYYFIEYRQPIGYDSINSIIDGSQIFDGVFIRLEVIEEGGNTQLIDTTPHLTTFDLSQYEDSIDSVLKVGETYTDNNIQIHLISISPDSAIVEIGSSGSPSPDIPRRHSELTNLQHIGIF